ncbi:hypothetical protein WG66_010589 [Moniliophthora roreri]|uniref:Uncharacterized protein n=1 Tax=Moniliophthora roreri TaxID=221103 RepID=A0A0W0G343_MONRR|nr:hypothetical protein WG66_010589 [Moniliophthora roreri]
MFSRKLPTSCQDIIDQCNFRKALYQAIELTYEDTLHQDDKRLGERLRTQKNTPENRKIDKALREAAKSMGGHLPRDPPEKKLYPGYWDKNNNNNTRGSSSSKRK